MTEMLTGRKIQEGDGKTEPLIKQRKMSTY